MDDELKERQTMALEKIAEALKEIGTGSMHSPGVLEYIGVALGGPNGGSTLPETSVASGLYEVADAIRDLAHALTNK